MAAVVISNTLGLSANARALAGLQAGEAAVGKSGESIYVNAATGNLIVQGQDELLATRGLDINVLRTYNSQGILDGDNNDNWRIGFYRQIRNLIGAPNTANSSVVRVDADGAEQTYTWDGSRYVNHGPDGGADTLAFASNTWTWTDGASRNTETYDWNAAIGSGTLQQQADSAGNTTSYSYNGSGLLTMASSASGETVYLDYNGSNLAQVRTVRADASTATRTRYGYDAANRLTSVIVDLSPDDSSIGDNQAFVSSYTYDGASKRIATLVQSDGTSLAFAYDASGRITRITDALNNQTQYSYGSNGLTTTVTDPLGQQSVWTCNAQGQLLQVQSLAGNSVLNSSSYAYNSNGDLIQSTDAQGRRTVWQYDANGNQILSRDEAGNTTTRKYDANNRLLAETTYLLPDADGADPANANALGAPGIGLTTSYVYDASSQLRFTISAQGRVTEYRYNSYGQQTSIIQYRGTTFSGNNETSVLSEADLASWVSNSADKSRSLRTDLAYDFRGQLASSTVWSSVDSSGVGVAGTGTTTVTSYDSAGRLRSTIAVIGGAQRATSLTYDGLGRLLTSTDSQNQTTSYAYDDAGNKVSVGHVNGLITVSSYDSAGRLKSVRQTTSANLDLGATRYYYDGIGQLRMTQDATGVCSWLFYDAAGRKVGELDGNGSLTEYVYDNAKQLTQTLRYAAQANTAGLQVASDGPLASALAQTLADVRPAGSANDQKSWNAYDAAGRLVKQVAADGSVTETVYDGADRAIRQIAYANPISTASLSAQPAASAIAPIASAADRVSVYLYDGDGRLRGSIDGEGYLTETCYDSAGLAWKTIRYATAVPAGSLAAISASTTVAALNVAASINDIVSIALYDGAGNAVGRIDGEGYLTESTYDAQGNATSVKRYATRLSAALIASLASNATLSAIRPSASAADQVTTTTYNALNLVASETAADGTQTVYSYDADGNLLSTTRAANSAEARTTRSSYDLLGQVLSQTDARNGVTSNAYDAAGRLKSSTDANQLRTMYYYDEDGALVYTVNAAGEVQRNTYDHLGQSIGSTQYAARLTTETLSTLNGGLLDAGARNTFNALANASADISTGASYNALGLMASSTDALGNLTQYQYNNFGEQISVIVPLGANTTRTDNTSRDRRGLALSSTVDAGGLNLVTSTQYDAFGRAIGEVDARGKLTQTSYDKLGRAVTRTDPLGATTSSSYDAFGRVLTQTDALGNTTTTSYSTANRSMTVTNAAGMSVTTYYNAHGEVTGLVDGAGNLSTYAYDANGNLVQKNLPNGVTTSEQYDAGGRLQATTDARGVRTVLSHDAANRILTRTVDPNGAGYTGMNLVTSYSYDAFGRQVSVTDPGGGVTQMMYDNAGRLAYERDAAGAVKKYTYDADGKLLTETRYANLATVSAIPSWEAASRFGVTADGLTFALRISGTINVAQAGSYTFYTRSDDGSNLYIDGNLVVANDYTQAATTRSASITLSAGVHTIVETYCQGNGGLANDFGILAGPAGTAAGNNFGVSYSTLKVEVFQYTDPGLLLSSLGLTASANGNVATKVGEYLMFSNWTPFSVATIATLADPGRDQVTSMTYDAAGRLTRSVDAAGGVTSYAYDAEDNLIGKTDANGNLIRYVRDAAGQLIYTIDPLGAVSQQVYDAAGQLMQTVAYAQTISLAGLPAAPTEVQVASLLAPGAQDRTETRVYDAAGRLAYQQDAAGAVQKFSYDGNGNLISSTALATLPAAGKSARVPYVAGTNSAMRRALGSYSAGETVSVNLLYKASGNQAAMLYIGDGGGTPGNYAISGAVAGNGGWQKMSLTYTATRSITLYAYLYCRALNGANVAGDAVEYDNVQVMTSRGELFNDSFDTLAWSDEANGGVSLANVPALSAATAVSLVVTDSNADQVTSHFYDGAGRRVMTVSPAGAAVGYVYDSAGNLVTETHYATLAKASPIPSWEAASRFVSTADGASFALRIGGTINVSQAGTYTFYTRSDDGSNLYIDGNLVVANDYMQGATTRSGSITLSAGSHTIVETYCQGNGGLANDFGISAGPAGTSAANNFGVTYSPLRVEVFDHGYTNYLLSNLGLTASANGSILNKVGEYTMLTAWTPINAATLAMLADPARDQVTTMVYDKAGRMTSRTDAVGTTVNSSYDANGKLVRTTASAGLQNLAQGKFTTQSSTYGDSDAVGISGHAVDGSTDGYFVNDSTTHTQNDMNAWWQVDLGASYSLNSVELFNRTDGPGARLSNFMVFVSDTDLIGRSYSSIVADTSVRRYAYAGTAGAWLQLATPTSGRYVRVQLAGQNFLSLAECRVWGKLPDRVTDYEYDRNGQLTRTIARGVDVYNAESTSTLLANGATGQASRSESRQDLAAQTWYDGNGNVVAQRDTAGNTSFKTWDGAGRLRHEVDAEGYATAYQYDALGQVVQLTRYANKIADSVRQAWNVQATTVAQVASALTASSADRTVTTSYDAAGNRILVVMPQVLANDGSSSFIASPTTAFTYNAFGELVKKSELQRGATWLNSWSWYDRNGREVASADAMNYLTTRRYDAFGNVVEQTEFANATGGLGLASYSLPVASDADRKLVNAWDQENRMVSQTRINVEYADTFSNSGVTLYTDSNFGGASKSIGVGVYNMAELGIAHDAISSLRVANGYTVQLYEHGGFQGRSYTFNGDCAQLSGMSFDNITSSVSVERNAATRGNLVSTYRYDAFGNQVQMIDAAGKSTSTFYDQANRIKAITEPSRGAAVPGGYNNNFIGLTEYVRDGFGNVLQQVERVNGATFVNAFAYAAITHGADRVSSTFYDAWGRQIASTDSAGTIQYQSWNAQGQVAKQWSSASNNSGVTRTVFKAMSYDRNGRLIHTIDPGVSNNLAAGASNVVDRQQAWNAFGEVVARGVVGIDNGWSEYLDYDNNGRVWRSNSGDGVNKVMLYDLQGNQRSEIRGATNLAQGRVATQSSTYAEGSNVWVAGRAVDGTVNTVAAGNSMSSTNYEANPWWQVDLGESQAINTIQIYNRTDGSMQRLSNFYVFISDTDLTGSSYGTLVNDATIRKIWVAGQAPTGLTLAPFTRGRYVRIQLSGTDLLTLPEVVVNGLGNASAADSLAGIRRQRNVVDALGRVTQRIDANGVPVYQTWDRWGNLLTVSDPTRANAVSSTMVYNANNQLIQETRPTFNSTIGTITPVTRLLYDYAGNRVTTIDARGYPTGTVFDSMGNALAEINPDGGVVRHVYDAFGNEVQRTDALGNDTYYQYDKAGRRTGTVRPLADFHTVNDRVFAYNYSAPVTGFVNWGQQGAYQTYWAGTYKFSSGTAEYLTLERTRSIVANTGYAAIVNDITDPTYVSTDSQWIYGFANIWNGGGHTFAYDVHYLKVMGNDATNPLQLASDRSSRLQNAYDQRGQLLGNANAAGLSVLYDYDLRGNMVRRIDPGNVTTTSTYDALNRKISETNANNNTNYWTYDYFGRLVARTDLGGATYSYTYDAYGQLIQETNSRGKNTRTTYNLPGQAVRIDDIAGDGVARATLYGYDALGRRTWEATTFGGGVEQDQTLSYDALGRLTQVARYGGGALNYAYDAAGNRIYQEENLGGSTRGSYFAYDAMNRQILVDGGVDNNAYNNVNLAQGKRITYDRNGNRVREESTTLLGSVVHNYTYDALNRLTLDSTQDFTGTWTLRYWYDRADRVVGQETSYGETQMTRYNSAGRIDAQATVLDWSYNYGTKALTLNTYDAAGNLTVAKSYGTGYSNSTTYTYAPYAESYQQIAIKTGQSVRQTGNFSTTSGGQIYQEGTTTLQYDPNGYLYRVDRSGMSTLDSSMGYVLGFNPYITTIYNDVNGMALHKVIGFGAYGSINNLVANGQVLGSWGTDYENGEMVTRRDFINYGRIDAQAVTAGQSAYRVRAGDTLRSIALAVYGDAQLWYVLADANGVTDGDLTQGRMLVTPQRTSGLHNSNVTSEQYSQVKLIGDTSPYVPNAPAYQKSQCATISIIIAAVLVALVITVISAGLASAAAAAAGTAIGMSATASAIAGGVVGGAIGGALSSMGSQGVMIAGGLQDQMRWRDVAAGAISGAISGGVSAGIGVLARSAASASKIPGSWNWRAAQVTRLGRLFGSSAKTIAGNKNVLGKLAGWGNVLGRGMLYGTADATGDAVSQGINVGAGLQDSFSWSQVMSTFVAGASAGAGNHDFELERMMRRENWLSKTDAARVLRGSKDEVYLYEHVRKSEQAIDRNYFMREKDYLQAIKKRQERQDEAEEIMNRREASYLWRTGKFLEKQHSRWQNAVESATTDPLLLKGIGKGLALGGMSGAFNGFSTSAFDQLNSILDGTQTGLDGRKTALGILTGSASGALKMTSKRFIKSESSGADILQHSADFLQRVTYYALTAGTDSDKFQNEFGNTLGKLQNRMEIVNSKRQYVRRQQTDRAQAQKNFEADLITERRDEYALISDLLSQGTEGPLATGDVKARARAFDAMLLARKAR